MQDMLIIFKLIVRKYWLDYIAQTSWYISYQTVIRSDKEFTQLRSYMFFAIVQMNQMDAVSII